MTRIARAIHNAMAWVALACFAALAVILLQAALDIAVGSSLTLQAMIRNGG